MLNGDSSGSQPQKISEEFSITPTERKQASVLIVDPDLNYRSSMKQAIKALGYGGISEASSHSQGLDKLLERRYSIILFDAKKSNVNPADFLAQVLKNDRDTVAIPMSIAPRVDDVFNLLVLGAKGFLAKPFTTDTVDESMVWAVKGEPISDIVLKAKDRNEALVAMMVSALDSTSTLLRQSGEFATARAELPKAFRGLKRAADMAKTFCKGSDEDLINAVSEFCLARGQGPASRLGRLRQRLKK